MADKIIHITGLQRWFRMGREVVKALDGVDLSIGRGEFVALTGPSGSGKSTLLYLLGGLDRPTSGSIVVDGAELGAMDEHALAEFRRTKIGFVFQQFNLIPTMTASQNVQFPMVFAGVNSAQRNNRALKLLKDVGLGNRAGHKPTELSGGQQQRVAIARALVNNPQIILADEPTGNLDSKVGAEIIALFKQLHAQGRTIILVSHDPGVIEQVPRVYRMRDGVIVDG
jgi:putative ABC transport system ATP-binding protein